MHSTELETQQLINSLNTALVMVDNKLTIVYANHAGEALFETGLKQLIGHPLQDFFLPGTIETTRLKAAIRKGEDFTENEIKLAFRDNRYVSADLTVTNLHFEDGPRLLFEVKKIDQQKRISRETLQNAQHYAALAEHLDRESAAVPGAAAAATTLPSSREGPKGAWR